MSLKGIQNPSPTQCFVRYPPFVVINSLSVSLVEASQAGDYPTLRSLREMVICDQKCALLFNGQVCKANDWDDARNSDREVAGGRIQLAATCEVIEITFNARINCIRM